MAASIREEGRAWSANGCSALPPLVGESLAASVAMLAIHFADGARSHLPKASVHDETANSSSVLSFLEPV